MCKMGKLAHTMVCPSYIITESVAQVANDIYICILSIHHKGVLFGYPGVRRNNKDP